MKTNKLLLFSLTLLTIGLIVCSYFNPNIKPENFSITLNNQTQLFGQIYLPPTGIKPYPTMILTHGINSSKESMTPLALELARHGIASVTFDFGNYGESSQREATQEIQSINLEETAAIYTYIQQFPEKFMQTKIGIGGHSMGGTVALDFAMIHPEIQTTVLLGIGGEASPESPHNLLYAVGLYEELNPSWIVKSHLQSASEQSANIGIVNGSFAQGNARKLVISPTSDHFIAPYDSILIGAIVDWVIQSFGLVNNFIFIRVTFYILGTMFIFIGAILWCLYLGLILPCQWQNRVTVGVVNFIFVSIVFGLNYSRIITPAIGSNLLMFGLGCQLLINYAFFKGKEFWLISKSILIYGIILSLAFLLPASVANGLGEIINHPVYLKQLPWFICQWLFLIIYNIKQHLKQELFTLHTIKLVPSYIYFISLIFATIFPHFIIKKVEDTVQYLLDKIRQPLHFTGIGKLSQKYLFLILFLFFVLGVILYHQIKIGLVNEAISRGLDGLKLFVQLLVLPSILFISILRSRQIFLSIKSSPHNQ